MNMRLQTHKFYTNTIQYMLSTMNEWKNERWFQAQADTAHNNTHTQTHTNARTLNRNEKEY